MGNSKKEKCKRFTIMVGMNDADTLDSKIDPQKIIKLVHNCCKSYGCAYSTSLTNGGYITDNGDYVVEQSISIVLIAPENEGVVDEIAKDLCAFLNQECVMVTVDEVEKYFVSEGI